MKYFNAQDCSYTNYTISELFGDSHVIMENCRFKHNVLYTPEHVAMMGEIGFPESEYKSDILTSRILRTLINPSKYIYDYILEFKRKHYVGHDVFGVQVRMGGCYANYKEGSELISLETLQSLPELIRNSSRHLTSPVIYLSTDSDYAENYLRESLPDIPVLTSSSIFVRKHSTGKAALDGVQGAIVDVILLSDSDLLLINKGSGFGTIASAITRAKEIIRLNVTRHPALNYNKTTRKCVF